MLFKKYLLPAIFLFLSINVCFAQVAQEWVQRYDGPGNNFDDSYSIAVDDSGNVYITGESRSGSILGTEDYATMKYNSLGVQQWVQRYNGPGNGSDRAYSIAVDGSGNVYVTGGSVGSQTTGYDYVTIKYNSSGIQQWLQRYNGPGNYVDGASSIAVDASGNVYVTGYSYGGWYDYATIKYNSSGTEQWVQRYNGPGNAIDWATSIAVDGSGNVYVTGYSEVSSLNYDYATVKYNSSGTEQWVQRYNGPDNKSDYANSIAVDGSGNVYVTGRSEVSGFNYDYATIKYNSSGIQQWVQRYNGPGNNFDEAYSIAVDGSGNIYVTGFSSGSGTGYDYATIKYSSSGIQQWVQRYNGPGNSFDEAYSLAVDSSDNVYVTGGSIGSGTGYDYATIKYNSLGIQQWVQRYNGPVNGSDKASSIVVSGSGNVYITGSSTGSGTENDYATIKYSQTVGIKPISTKLPDKFELFQNYPNPFNPVTKIRFDVRPPLNSLLSKEGAFVILKIYDILSREVATLVNEQLNAGTYEVVWDGSNYPSGVYYYTLKAGNYTATKKLVLLK
jgi:uncharacterized delta-60 repeat protein